MIQYSIEPIIKKMLKDMDFYHLRENIKKQLLNTGLDSLKTAFRKEVHKAAEFIGNKIADTVTKSNDDETVKQEPVEEIVIPTEKIDKILNKLRKVL